MATNAIDRATLLLAQVQLELEAKGYPPGLVRKSLDRARGMAESKSRPIRTSIRNEAFYDMLVHELDGAEDWMIHLKQFRDGEFADRE